MSLTEEMHEESVELSGYVTESAYDVVRVEKKDLALVWSQATQYLIYGLSVNPNLKVGEIVDGLLDESIQLWVIIPSAGYDEMLGCFLTSVERDAGEWVVTLFNLGGRRPKEWVMACHEAMHEFAKVEGAKRVRLCGRPAWQRILPGYAVVGEKSGHLIYERNVG